MTEEPIDSGVKVVGATAPDDEASTRPAATPAKDAAPRATASAPSRAGGPSAWSASWP